MGRARRTPLLLALGAALAWAPLAGWADDAADRGTPGWWLAKAEGIARQVEHPEARAALLVSIGTGWVEAGGLEQARPLLAAAVEYGTKCRGCLSKARRLAEVALLQHRAGDALGSGRTFDVARAACEEVGGGAQRVQSLAYLAQLRQEAGEAMLARMLFADATKAALALEGLDREEALAAVADAEVAAGNLKEAGRVRMRLSGGLGRIGADALTIVTSTWLTAAAAEMQAGHFGTAEILLASVTIWPLAVSGYASLARAKHEAGNPNGATDSLRRAFEIASNLSDPVERADAYAEIARVATDIGAAERAEKARAGVAEACLQVEDLAAHVRALVVWAEVLREAGARDRMAQVLVQVARMTDATALDAATRDRLRGVVGGAEARAGRFVPAEKLTGAIEDPAHRVRARLDLAEAYRKAGKEAQALVVCGHQLRTMAAWSEDLAADRAESMRQAARLQAACGRLEDAAKTVDAIDRPFHAATACTYIASDLTGE